VRGTSRRWAKDPDRRLALRSDGQQQTIQLRPRASGGGDMSGLPERSTGKHVDEAFAATDINSVALGVMAATTGSELTRDSLVSLFLFEICTAQAIDFYPGKGRGQRQQRDGLQPVMRWSAEQRAAD